MASKLDGLKQAWLSTCAAALLLGGCAAHKETQPQAIRQRFVPGQHDSTRNGASWTALHPGPSDRPGVLLLLAHAGVGDTFPVQEEGQPKLFDVLVVTGDDDALVLEVRSEEGSRRLNVRRDEAESVKVAGHAYSLAYPSITVGPDSKPTKDTAMILVHRFP